MIPLYAGKNHTVTNHAQHQYSSMMKVLKERGDWKNHSFRGLKDLNLKL